MSVVGSDIRLFLKNALGDQLGDRRKICLLWIRIHRSGHWKRAEVVPSLSAMGIHVLPGLVSLWHFMPGALILQEDGLACKHDVRQIDGLVRCHWHACLVSEFH